LVYKFFFSSLSLPTCWR